MKLNPLIHQSYVSLIGNTPMVRLRRFTPQGGADILAKVEWFNPGGSIKDRAALYMLRDAMEKGVLDGKVIVEATSGNTGIALAMLSAYYGLKLLIITPETVSREKLKALELLGASVMLTAGEEGTAGAIRLKNRIMSESPERYISLDQFRNPMNPLAHYYTTGAEIIRQTNGKFNALVVGIGTAGTGVGCAMRVKEHDRGITVIGVAPKKGVVVPGIRYPYDEEATEIYDEKYFDEIRWLEKDDVERIRDVIKEVATKEGMLVGWSSGAVLLAAKEASIKLKEGKAVVAVLADSGYRYLDEL